MFAADPCRILSSDLAPILLNRIAFAGMLPGSRVDVNINVVRRMLDYISGHNLEMTQAERNTVNSLIDLTSADSITTIRKQDGYILTSAIYGAALRGGLMDDFSNTYPSHTMMKLTGYAEDQRRNNDFIRSLAGSDQMPIVWQHALMAREFNIIKNNEQFNPDAYQLTDRQLISDVSAAHIAARSDTVARELPYDEAGNLMRSLIAPFHGKYLLVDFWDTTCGPCRVAIEESREMRERNHGNPEFAILYIASGSGSPRSAYDEYVAKHLAGEKVIRLNDESIQMFREMFSFDGIPRYILFDREGRVVSDNYSMFDFWQLLRSEQIIAD